MGLALEKASVEVLLNLVNGLHIRSGSMIFLEHNVCTPIHYNPRCCMYGISTYIWVIYI